MDRRNQHEDFAVVEQQLRDGRAKLTPLERDGLKRKTMSKTGSTRMNLRARLVQGLLVVGLVGTGGAAVLAASDGNSNGESSAKQQYCPPNSPNAGQPQGPGNNCGNPPETCPNGNPKPPGGNCGNGNPRGEPEKPNKKRRARFRVKRKPPKRCYSDRFVMRVLVINKKKGAKTRVSRDGKRVKIKRSGKKRFYVRFNVRKLKPGVHKLKLRVRGRDGKMRTRTVKFRRC
jgi:hypothetical protein